MPRDRLSSRLPLTSKKVDLLEQERIALAAYEQVVVLCTDWARAHYQPGTKDWEYVWGMLDCFVRYGIRARERFLTRQAIGEPAPGDDRFLRDILHALEKLLSGAYNWAGDESRRRLEPFVQIVEQLTDGRGVGLLHLIRPNGGARHS